MKINFKPLKRLFFHGRNNGTTAIVESNGDNLTTEQALIDEYMRKSKPFLYNRYSIFQLSEETGVSMTDVISIIHRQRHAGFHEFIASYRISYCKQLLDQIPIYTVDIFDLTVICGFTDQEEFCAAFKKITHVNISKYIRRLCRERL